MTTTACSAHHEIVAPSYRTFAESILRSIVDIMGDAVVGIDEAQRIILFNRAAEEMFGYTGAEIFEQPLGVLIPAESQERHADLVARFVGKGDAPTRRRMEEREAVSAVCKDGRHLPIGATIASVELEFGKVMVAVVRDISRHLEVQNRLLTSLRHHEELARTDPLTELMNVRAFKDAVRKEVARCVREGGAFTLAYIDVDHFKSVNDSRGHAFGDEVLKAIALRLQEHTRQMDCVARIGGDEFAILFPGSWGDSVYNRVCGIRAMLLEDVQQKDIPVTFSIGVLTCDDIPDEVETCLHQADNLMYRIKRSTRDGIAYGTLAQLMSDDGVDAVPRH